EERQDQADDLDAVIWVQGNMAHRRTRSLAMKMRSRRVDDGPCESGEKAQRAGEIGEKKIPLLMPRQNGLDGEFGKGLEPREYCKREALGDKELRGLRAPGD